MTIMISRMPASHERLERIVNHRPVVDRQQMLVRHLGQRAQPRSETAGKNDAFHVGGLIPAGAEKTARIRSRAQRSAVSALRPQPSEAYARAPEATNMLRRLSGTAETSSVVSLVKC